MSEGAVRSQLVRCDSRVMARPNLIADIHEWTREHTVYIGLTAIFNLPYFIRHRLGMRCFGPIILWLTSCAAGWISHLTFSLGSLDGNRL